MLFGFHQPNREAEKNILQSYVSANVESLKQRPSSDMIMDIYAPGDVNYDKISWVEPIHVTLPRRDASIVLFGSFFHITWEYYMCIFFLIHI